MLGDEPHRLALHRQPLERLDERKLPQLRAERLFVGAEHKGSVASGTVVDLREQALHVRAHLGGAAGERAQLLQLLLRLDAARQRAHQRSLGDDRQLRARECTELLRKGRQLQDAALLVLPACVHDVWGADVDVRTQYPTAVEHPVEVSAAGLVDHAVERRRLQRFVGGEGRMPAADQEVEGASPMGECGEAHVAHRVDVVRARIRRADLDASERNREIPSVDVPRDRRRHERVRSIVTTVLVGVVHDGLADRSVRELNDQRLLLLDGGRKRVAVAGALEPLPLPALEALSDAAHGEHHALVDGVGARLVVKVD